MRVLLAKKADKALEKMDKITKGRILKYLAELETFENPRTKGRALVGNLAGFWRYRIGDYRVICEIIDSELIIYAIDITHRKNAY